MAGFIYVIRDGQHVCENVDVYKLGLTVQRIKTTSLKRLKAYCAGTEVKFICEVPEEHVIAIEAKVLLEVAKTFPIFSGGLQGIGEIWRILP